MRKSTLITGAGVLAAGFTTLGALATSGVGTADSPGEQPQALRGMGETLAMLQDGAITGRRHDPYPDFDFIVRYFDDMNIGRVYVTMEGMVGGGEHFVVRRFRFTERETMDVHTVVFHGRSSKGTINFMRRPADGSSDPAGPMKAIIPYSESDHSTTVNFDPPLRMDPGDIIFAGIENLPSTVTGFTLVSLHGTVPPDGVGGDMMMVE